jgi:hypothetical protein
VKSIFSKSLILAILFAGLVLSIASAEVKQINLLDRNGKIVEQYGLNLSGNEAEQANERMRFFWYCWSKKMFSNLSCDTESKSTKKVVAQNVFSQQVATAQALPVTQQPVTFNSTSPSVNDQQPTTSNQQPSSGSQIIYQVIERAVPGPQGPAGRDGADYYGPTQNNLQAASINTSSQFLAQYSSSPTYSAQYNGFGIQSNNAVNPTGDAVLSTISGSGLLSCNATSSKLVYNSTTKMFECGTDQGSGGLSAMPENATFTLATVTSATSTNFFSAILSATTNYLTNLLFTNATGTNATTTNFATTNLQTSGFSIIPSIYGTFATFTNATTTNLVSTYNIFTNATITSATNTNLYAQNATFTGLNAQQATFSYATVTNGFFTNLSVTGPVSAALSNGSIFRGGTNNFSEATSTIFLSDSGRVGVGTTTPGAKFSVGGDVLISGNLLAPKATSLPATTGANTERMMCINKTTGELKIDTNGDCYTFVSGAFSDINLKKNIATVTNALDKVKGLSTVNFNWIDDTRGTTTQLGYIAQDVEKVFPEVIVHDDSGFLKVNYISLSAIYANAIKELDKLVFENINVILDRLTKNEEEILNLKTRVSNLESSLSIPAPITPTVPAPEPEVLPQAEPSLPQESTGNPDTSSSL